MNRRRVILRQKGDEIVRAASLFGEALFSKDPGAFLEGKGEELERELARRGALDVEGHANDDDKGK